MAVYTLARFQVRADADAVAEAERAMHEVASYVRRELAGSSWTAFRDPEAPHRFVVMLRAEHAVALDAYRAAPGVQAFGAAIAPLLDGPIEESACELVTSSDLAPRRPGGRRRP